MIRFVSLAILIFLDFIIFLMPTYILSLIINFLIILIWYFPSLYQLYSFIFTTKEYDSKMRIYLLLISLIIIVLYIPFFTIYSIGYAIFFSLINPLITIIQRPGYPLYSLSPTAAIIHLIYKYIYNHSIEEFLLDFLLLEKIKEVKQHCHFHPLKFPEIIKQFKSIFIILDFFIIFLILIIIIIPDLIISTTILVIFYSLMLSYDLSLKLLINNYKFSSSYIKFWYLLLLIFVPFSYITLFIILLIVYNLYGICWYFKVIARIFSKAIEIYYKNDNNGFYDVIDFFWAIIIEPFLSNGNEVYIYVCFRINLNYSQDMLNVFYKLC